MAVYLPEGSTVDHSEACVKQASLVAWENVSDWHFEKEAANKNFGHTENPGDYTVSRIIEIGIQYMNQGQTACYCQPNEPYRV
jgi:hypothetical protein